MSLSTYVLRKLITPSKTRLDKKEYISIPCDQVNRYSLNVSALNSYKGNFLGLKEEDFCFPPIKQSTFVELLVNYYGGFVIGEWARKKEVVLIGEDLGKMLKAEEKPFKEIDIGVTASAGFIKFCNQESDEEPWVNILDSCACFGPPKLARQLTKKESEKVEEKKKKEKEQEELIKMFTTNSWERDLELQLEKEFQRDVLEEDFSEEEDEENYQMFDKYGCAIYNRRDDLLELVHHKHYKMVDLCRCGNQECTCA